MIPYVRARRTIANGPEAEVELRPIGERVRVRLRVGNQLHEAQLGADACRELEAIIAAAAIPLVPAESLVGIGNGFELQVGSLPSCAIVSWVRTPPAGWEACAAVLHAVLLLAERAAGDGAFQGLTDGIQARH